MNNRQIKFIFDLDGTITSKETLPIIAAYFGVAQEMSRLTEETVRGNVPFIESFIRRVHVLGKLPVSQVDSLLGRVPLYSLVVEFIQRHQSQCVIATGNLRAWISKLVSSIGCECHCSDALVKDDQVIKLTHILQKENVVERYQSDGYTVVFIGEGNNDMEAMRVADISIASGLTHQPAQSVLTISDYLVYSEEALCRMLNQLC
jgi:HAD superfamily phosphoserine phosphatase-like hydrolase